MTAASTTTWWIVGYAIGGVVVALVAALLILAIALVRRLVRQAGDIVAGLEGARGNTEPLIAIANVNGEIDRIHTGLRALREAAAKQNGESAPGAVGRIRERLTGGGS